MRNCAILLLAIFVTLANAEDQTDIDQPVALTQCTSGASDILGSRKAFTIQVCNLFGSSCVVNHPAIESANCGTEALEIDSGECKLYPIFEYEDNYVRSGPTAVELLTVDRSISWDSSNYDSKACKIDTKTDDSGTVVASFGGSCVVVSCDLGVDQRAGPAFRGQGYAEEENGWTGKWGRYDADRRWEEYERVGSTTAVTDTTAHDFKTESLVSFPPGVLNTKTVFLSRTGNYVATSSHHRQATGDRETIGYYIGTLPTAPEVDDWTQNYGPVSCPYPNNKLDSTTAEGITAEDLRMCGYNKRSEDGFADEYFLAAVNLVRDAELYAEASGDTDDDDYVQENDFANADDNEAMGSSYFLDGSTKSYEHAYYSWSRIQKMDDPRKVYLYNGENANADLYMTSDILQPQVGKFVVNSDFSNELGGAYRTLGVAFYCSDYARTDLTTCSAENLQTFYFCDPNPNACWGSATQVSSNLGRLDESCTAGSDCCSGECTIEGGEATVGICAAGCEAAGDYRQAYDTCTCANGGTAASGAKCTADSANICTKCTDEFYLNSVSKSCDAWTDPCTMGHIETQAPSNMQDRVCEACKSIDNCDQVDCTTDSDQTCTTCGKGHYGDGTSTCSACESVDNCGQAVECTNDSDQTCTACEEGHYGDGTSTCSVNECIAEIDTNTWAAKGCVVTGNVTGITVSALGDQSAASGYTGCVITCLTNGEAFTVTTDKEDSATHASEAGAVTIAVLLMLFLTN